MIAEAQKLRAAGLDANQIAGVLCKKDPQGKNYGIGILVGDDGMPLPTSATLLEYLRAELERRTAWMSKNLQSQMEQTLAGGQSAKIAEGVARLP